jgi:DNA polymerase III delta prime subunit
MGTLSDIKKEFWCERVRICFSLFVANPNSLKHLLLFGPPGSGKTTSASWLVDQIWGSRKSLMCMSMNAADERSLESIRQKVYPFLRVDWRESSERSYAPRFLTLDECETLTEAAQLSLQTILNIDNNDICVILICNSQSRIHPKLRQRLLKIRYDPPNHKTISTCVQNITRGDLRVYPYEKKIQERIQNYLNMRIDSLSDILQDEMIDYQVVLSEILILSNNFCILDEEILDRINMVYTLLKTSYSNIKLIEKQLVDILKLFRQKFECMTV